MTLLIAPRQFHVYAQIPIQVGLRPVKVEVADGNSAQIAADPRVDRFAHDAIHARERADIDDPRGALFRQVHYLPNVQHHLAESALPRQVGTGAFQNLVDIGLFAAREVFLEGLHQDVLVALLYALPDPRPQGFGGPDPAFQLEFAEVLGIGVPDPLHQIGEPGFRAVAFQTLDQVLVREGVQPAEDLAHDPDQRQRARGGSPAGPQLPEPAAASHHRVAQPPQLHARFGRSLLQRAAEVR